MRQGRDERQRERGRKRERERMEGERQKEEERSEGERKGRPHLHSVQWLHRGGEERSPVFSAVQVKYQPPGVIVRLDIAPHLQRPDNRPRQINPE